MQKLNILNAKEVKKLGEMLVQQFGAALEGDYVYLENQKNRIFIVSKDVAQLPLHNLIIDRIGLYLGEIWKDQFRLSKEGAELLGREAEESKKKLQHLVSLTLEETKQYFQGLDLPKDLGAHPHLVLLQFHQDILGCAKYKEGKILNFMPKIHRGEVIL